MARLTYEDTAFLSWFTRVWSGTATSPYVPKQLDDFPLTLGYFPVAAPPTSAVHLETNGDGTSSSLPPSLPMQPSATGPSSSSSSNAMYRGMVATRDIFDGECVLRIPDTLFLSVPALLLRAMGSDRGSNGTTDGGTTTAAASASEPQDNEGNGDSSDAARTAADGWFRRLVALLRDEDAGRATHEGTVGNRERGDSSEEEDDEGDEEEGEEADEEREEGSTPSPLRDSDNEAGLLRDPYTTPSDRRAAFSRSTECLLALYLVLVRFSRRRPARSPSTLHRPLGPHDITTAAVANSRDSTLSHLDRLPSFWTDYCDYLPPPDEIASPECWSDDVMESCIALPHRREEAQRVRREAREWYELLNRDVFRWLSSHRECLDLVGSVSCDDCGDDAISPATDAPFSSSSSSCSPGTPSRPPPSSLVSYSQWSWAIAMVGSRSFNVVQRHLMATSDGSSSEKPQEEETERDGGDEEELEESYCMMPFADLFNHSEVSGITEFGFDAASRCFVFYAGHLPHAETHIDPSAAADVVMSAGESTQSRGTVQRRLRSALAASVDNSADAARNEKNRRIVYRKGEQIFLRYSGGDFWHFVVQYGFVPQHPQPQDRVPLRVTPPRKASVADGDSMTAITKWQLFLQEDAEEERGRSEPPLTTTAKRVNDFYNDTYLVLRCAQRRAQTDGPASGGVPMGTTTTTVDDDDDEDVDSEDDGRDDTANECRRTKDVRGWLRGEGEKAHQAQVAAASSSASFHEWLRCDADASVTAVAAAAASGSSSRMRRSFTAARRPSSDPSRSATATLTRLLFETSDTLATCEGTSNLTMSTSSSSQRRGLLSALPMSTSASFQPGPNLKLLAVCRLRELAATDMASYPDAFHSKMLSLTNEMRAHEYLRRRLEEFWLQWCSWAHRFLTATAPAPISHQARLDDGCRSLQQQRGLRHGAAGRLVAVEVSLRDGFVLQQVRRAVRMRHAELLRLVLAASGDRSIMAAADAVVVPQNTPSTR